MYKYNVVFASDESFIQHISVAMLSLLENNKDIKIVIHFLIDSINDKNIQLLNEMIKKYNAEINFHIISDEIFNSLVCKHHFKKANYYRLLIPSLINEKKVLYLDGDVVVNGSIKKIFNLDLEKYFIAAIINPSVFKNEELGMKEEAKYFNSGVMLINIEKWKKEKVSERVISYISINSDLVQFPDQDALNSIINGNWKELDIRYNLQHSFFNKNLYTLNKNFQKSYVEKEIEEAIIIHYTGPSKPWHLRDTNPFKTYYWKYLKYTPYKRYFPNDISFINIIKFLVPKKLVPLLKKVIK